MCHIPSQPPTAQQSLSLNSDTISVRTTPNVAFKTIITGPRQEMQKNDLEQEENRTPRFGMTIPLMYSPLPTDPPPPYRSKCNSPYPPSLENVSTTCHWPRQQPQEQIKRHCRPSRLVVNGLGAVGVLFCMGVWTLLTKIESSSSLPLLEPELLVIGAIVAYASLVYMVVIFSSSTGTCVDSDSSSGSVTDALRTAQEESLQSGGMESETITMAGTNTDSIAVAHQGDATVTMKQSAVGLQEKKRPGRKLSLVRPQQYQSLNATKDLTIRRKSSSPVLTSSASTTLSMLQEVKNEFRLWAFSFFVLAPAIPWSLGGGGDRFESSVALKKGRVDDQDEHEYDIVQRIEARGSNMAMTKTISSSSSFPRAQDMVEASRRSRAGPTKNHVHKRGFSESIASAITKAPQTQTPRSTLSKLTGMQFDPERLGGIFQYYRRRHAATTNNDDGNDVHGQDGETSSMAIVVRSSALPTVRVGLYGAAQKRLWSSTGTMNTDFSGDHCSSP
ncbi:hypothetical protein BGX28_004654 [Mortierella sp. GBA30]|nr:hypothetical protein BGX28_004654 [Mortierella sp. GBA30]